MFAASLDALEGPHATLGPKAVCMHMEPTLSVHQELANLHIVIRHVMDPQPRGPRLTSRSPLVVHNSLCEQSSGRIRFRLCSRHRRQQK